jgi:hypothetical protein
MELSSMSPTSNGLVLASLLAALAAAAEATQDKTGARTVKQALPRAA